MWMGCAECASWCVGKWIWMGCAECASWCVGKWIWMRCAECGSILSLSMKTPCDMMCSLILQGICYGFTPCYEIDLSEVQV